MVIAVRFLAVIVLVGEEFDCCSISLSFGDDADGAVAAISVLEIGRVGSSAVVLRDFFVTVSVRLKVRGHDDGGGGGCSAKGTVKAEVRPGVEKYIICRAAGQTAGGCIRCVALRVAAEVQAAGKGEVRSIIQYKYTAAPILGLIAGDGTLLEGKR